MERNQNKTVSKENKEDVALYGLWHYVLRKYIHSLNWSRNIYSVGK